MRFVRSKSARSLLLSDKVVVITGAGAGIGAATARQLDDAAATVVLIDRDAEALERVAATLRHPPTVFVADVRDATSVDAAVAAAVEMHGGIDVVVANAGIVGPVATFAATSATDFETVIDVNVLGAARTVRAALPSVVDRCGYVLVVASAAAAIPTPTIAAYGVSKAGAEALGRALRMELTETGATAGVAYFGLIDTGMVRNDLLGGTGLGTIMSVLPGWFGEPAPVEDAARAIVRGIARRSRWVYAPRYMPALLGLRTSIALVEPVLARNALLLDAIRQADSAAADHDSDGSPNVAAEGPHHA